MPVTLTDEQRLKLRPPEDKIEELFKAEEKFVCLTQALIEDIERDAESQEIVDFVIENAQAIWDWISEDIAYIAINAKSTEVIALFIENLELLHRELDVTDDHAYQIGGASFETPRDGLCSLAMLLDVKSLQPIIDKFTAIKEKREAFEAELKDGCELVRAAHSAHGYKDPYASTMTRDPDAPGLADLIAQSIEEDGRDRSGQQPGQAQG